MDNSTKPGRHMRLPTVAAGLLLAGVACVPASAQGLDSETAVNTIIGSDVQTVEVTTEEISERLVIAIANTTDSTQQVRRRFNLGEVGIAIVVDDDTANADAVQESVETHQLEIDDLRIAIEGSAMFYHAINSRRIQLSDVIAMEFDGDDVLIYVMDDNAQ